jgi:hypothetical protein
VDADFEGCALKKLLSRRWLLISGLVVLTLFLVRPGAGRLRWRISQSMSQQLGRRVEIGSVHFRFLPRPGFDLENLIVHDDAAFGAEPVLRSPEVAASLRVVALLRGRIEIARLSLNDASLNLMRDHQGKWTLNDLIQRNASITTAPTSPATHQSRAEFPYIEASHARVNFKIGNEKIHFALNDAELALWQDSDNAWGLRMKARPIRTDTNLTDTGLLSVGGIWQRSSVLSDTPMQFAFEWKQAQAGQVSRLFLGNDQGWRGSVLINGAWSGTPRKLNVIVHSSVDDFGRFDAFSDGDLHLAGDCSAEYSSTANAFSDIKCSAPVGDGKLELAGNFSAVLSAPSYGLRFIATQVPAQSLVSLLRKLKAKLPHDFTATGSVSGTVVANHDENSQAAELSGEGEINELTLRSGTAPALVVGAIPVALSLAPLPAKMKEDAAWQRVRIDLGSFTLPLGRPAPARVRATVSLTGYEASVRGDAGIKRLLQSAQILGIATPQISADGNSSVDLKIAGDWAGTPRPIVTGTAQLHSVYARIRGANAPLRLDSADLLLSDQSVRVRNLNAFAAGTVWHGTVEIPRPCVVPDSCPFQFNIRTAEASAAGLNEYLNPQAGNKSWYRLFPGKSIVPYLLTASASGKIAIDKLHLGNAVCTHFLSDVSLHSGTLGLASLQGLVLGGRANAVLEADFSSRPPAYSGDGKLEDVSLTQVASLMKSSWVEGLGSTHFQFKTSGYRVQDLLGVADLSADFAIKDGIFPNILLVGGKAPLEASLFAGKIALQNGDFSFTDTKLENETSVYKISGTASLDGALDLKMLSETSAGYNLSGTLSKTRVSRILTSATQASLK